MSEPRNALAARPRGSRNTLARTLRDRASEITEGFIGPPGSVWGEMMNAVMAGGRSVMPGGGSYEDELQLVREGREERYPGAYSVIPEVRREALLQALDDDLMGQAIGMLGPVARGGFLYHVTPRLNARAIAREGLRPDAPKIGEGGPHGDTQAVFLADEATVPVYRDLYGAGGEPLSVFRVPRQALRSLREDMASEGTAYMTSERIPPAALEVETARGWMPVVRGRR
jgi:hypothetical protein